MALFLSLVLLLSFSFRALPSAFFSVKADPSEGVHNLDTGLNYTSIQEAIDAFETLNGHTMLVDPGTYYERIKIYKSLAILGKDPTTTVIDGGGVDTVVHVNASDVCVSGFTIKNSGSSYLDCGIFLDYCVASNLSRNIITNCRYGLYVFHSRDNALICNNVSGNYEDGIWLYYSGNNLLVGNNASNNRYNFGVFGNDFSDFNNTIDTSNVVDGKPIQYLIDVSDAVLDNKMNIGNLYLINSANVTVRDLNLTNNGYGVFCWNITNSRIENITASANNYGIYLQNSIENTISHNHCPNNWVGICLQDSEHNKVDNNLTPNNEKGISLYESDSNIITRNVISNNLYGIRLFASNFNEAYHNNLIENTEQVSLINSNQNSWHNGVEGNFWNDYAGLDANRDGIGDGPFRGDKYPLMGMFSSFEVPLGIYVRLVSNSTINNFEYFESNSTIKIHISNMTTDQVFGFCRIQIPHSLMSEPFKVTIDGATPSYWNYTLRDDGENRWIYFNYEHSTREVIITQESQSLIIPLLFLLIIAFLLATFAIRGKIKFNRPS